MAEQAMWVSSVTIGAGARHAGVQPREHTRVMLDPAGHPFCLYPG